MTILGGALLTACAEPTTFAPRASQADIAREGQIQTDLAKGHGGAATPATAGTNAAATGAAPAGVNANVVPTAASRAQMEARIARLVAPLHVAATSMCADARLQLPQGCTFPVELAADGPLNAWTDGAKITVTPAMVAFTNDSELSFILAHEMGHDLMQHVASQQQNQQIGGIAGTLADSLAGYYGIPTQGALGSLGGQYGGQKFSKSFEREADYLGMYLIARAGLDYHSVSGVWRRMSQANPESIYLGQSHPGNAERYVNLDTIAREIDAKKAAGQPLLPNLKKK